MKNLLIIGAGGHGRVVGEIAHACGFNVSFLDDKPGENVIGAIHELNMLKDRFDAFFVGIGNNCTRKRLIDLLEGLDVNIVSLIHPTAYVSSSAVIEKGTVIEPGVIINSNCVIKKACIISVGAIIDHDSVIEEYSHINAGAICMSGSHTCAGQKIDAGTILHG